MIGERIKLLVDASRQKKRAIAAAIGKHETSLQNIFHSETIKSDVLEKLAVALETPITAFFVSTDDEALELLGKGTAIPKPNRPLAECERELDIARREIGLLKESVRDKNMLLEQRGTYRNAA